MTELWWNKCVYKRQSSFMLHLTNTMRQNLKGRLYGNLSKAIARHQDYDVSTSSRSMACMVLVQRRFEGRIMGIQCWRFFFAQFFGPVLWRWNPLLFLLSWTEYSYSICVSPCSILPVFFRKDVVENRVDGGGKVIEAPSNVVQLLVDALVHWFRDEFPFVFVKHDVEETLSVKRSPAHKKRNHYASCNNKRCVN